MTSPAQTMTTHTVRVHKPLWGGFPKHWLAGPIQALRLTENSSEADRYSPAETASVETFLRHELPGAVITRDAI